MIYETDFLLQNLKSHNVFEKIESSVLSGIADLSENAHFFNKSDLFQKSIRVSIVLEKVIKLEKFLPHMFNLNNFDFSDILSQNNASHVVVGVKYGWRTMINIELDLKDGQDMQNGLNELKIFAEKISCSVEIVEYTNLELQMAKNIRCTVICGEIAAEHFIFEDVVKICNKFDKRIETEVVPTSIFLVNLKEIVSESVYINSSLTEKLNEVIYFSECIFKLNELSKLPYLDSFLLFKQEINRSIKILEDLAASNKCENKKRISLNNTITKILRTRDVPSITFELFLEKWLNRTSEIATFLSNTLELFTNIKKCSNNEEILKEKKEITFVLAINTLIINDIFIQELQSYEHHDVCSKTYSICPNDRSFLVAFETVKNLNEFAVANKDSEVHAFFYTEDIFLVSENGTSFPISIKFFKNGKQEICPRFLPTKPGNITIEEISHESLSISWNEPHNGAEYVTHYVITAKELECSKNEKWFQYANSNERMQIKLKNLCCDLTYCIILQGVTNFGVTPPNHVEIKTLSTNQPENPRVSFMTENEIFMQTKHPDFKISELNLISEKKEIDTKLTVLKSNTETTTESKSIYSNSDNFINEPTCTFHREDVYSVDIFHFKLNESSKTERQFKFLRQLLSLDYHCRDQKKSQCAEKTPVLECNDEDDFFSNVAEETSMSQKLSEESSTDLIQKTLSLCDEFLIQDVYEKMTSCQLAVPILALRDRKLLFNLWAMRTVKKKWKTSIPTQNVYEGFITDIQMGTISFCRIGQNTSSMSKSHLANLFLSSAQGWSEHSYFLHRDVDSAQKLNRGCIEACWYCPEGRSREHLKDIHGIYNLRGDVRDNMEQFKFLLSISSVVIILIENIIFKKEETDLLKSFKGYVILLNFGQEGTPKTNDKKVWLYAMKKNQKELLESLLEYIPPVSQNHMSLEEQAGFALSFGFDVDEMNKDCLAGKKAAEEFMNMIKKYDIGCLKSHVVPLQGNDWVQWAKYDKEECRYQFRGETDPQTYSDNLRKKKKNLRKSQLRKGLSSEITFFLGKILEFKNQYIKKYFIEWCKIELNKMSDNILPTILKDFNNSIEQHSKLIKQLELLKNCSEIDFNNRAFTVQNLIDNEKKNISKLSEKFKNASFGIENVFRELGQVYESYEDEHQNKEVLNLPILMAELFLLGYPLEIMDGDATHVPLVWIQKVFTEVKKKIGENVKVFVISILGIQSSGKSTFLNTMFGSKFAVSSGRCTRGVFIQLIPVSQNLIKIMNCDYFILMDSEGLRSPELTDSFRHDNEIATLVTCLANATIINFWGQTFSKEMSDIMEIAAHAYIRMKKIQIKSSFHMIFAGVPDIDAEGKNKLGVGNILKELNNMVLRIAKEEGRVDIQSGFSSIFPLIQEELGELVFPEFFPALWRDSMSPPEPRYGEVVQELKNAICNALITHHNKILITQPITEFVTRLSDIWEAIKQENFVFGFKNSQAIIAFGEIQKLYDKDLGLLRRQLFDLSNQVAEECYQEVTMLKDENEGFSRYNIKFDERVLKNIDVLQVQIMENLRARVLEMSYPEMAAQHLPSFSLDMDKKVLAWLAQEKEVARENIFSICRKEKITPIKREQYRKKCLMAARKIASELKSSSQSSLDDDVVNNYFENMFDLWLAEAKKEDLESLKPLDYLYNQIWNDSKIHLCSKLNLLHPKNNLEFSNEITNTFDLFKHINENDDKRLFSIKLTYEDLRDTSNIIVRGFNSFVEFLKGNNEKFKQAVYNKNLIINKVKDIIKDSKKKAASHFNYAAFIGEILDQSNIELSKPACHNIDFSKSFKIKFLIKIYGASVKKMALLHLEHSKSMSFVNYLWNQQNDLLREFQIECKSADSDARAGERFMKSVFCEIVINQVKLSVGHLVYDSIIIEPQFNTKNKITYHVLKELIKAPYSQVQSYIDDYKTYVKNWIKDKVVF